ncbi:Gfo/Idh/MocA family protein [Paenibacillus sacheonensis]|uniref:Gfo/Idh/MocA family oxidoreductase n=1 Tax=Paenibacillus sacheonensis TaxID=742054 RepID=A0A7X5BYR1_9BACL|nr:Gfo/Idh/MocA family oxidoreductase [Paenibacillus sacheonensis]MBM7565297.1 putative dehydrogenase [Paenibacillus sacheonensis]NBC69932.1 Gfo/Idh/MocA family oxidoreductase [Paenibacillus sacheonensis]
MNQVNQAKQLRYGIIGIGNMGSGHAGILTSGTIKGAVLTAVCDEFESKRQWAEEQYGGKVAVFENASAMIASGLVDAVVVATPHYDHPAEAINALGKGMHVLIEKPAGVYAKQVREMNDAAAASGRKFGIVYNQRMNPLYQKLRELVASGEIGEIRRINWIITNWYRTQAYYDSGTWRATWGGEGGGVLINQCPHNLDLWQWTTGMMPTRMRAFCQFGKNRDIEVENDVTAYAEYANGATAVFITSTSDAPGTNRLEVSGSRGKIVIEDDRMTMYRLREDEAEFNARNKAPFASPEVWKIDLPAAGPSPEHVGILQNFTDAVLHGAPLVAPGEEGILGLTLSNAMHLSTWLDDWVDLPFDEALHEAELNKRIATSKFKRAQPAEAKN